MIEPGFYAIPNLNGRVPAKAPPIDRPLIVRNLANRIEGQRGMHMTEHLAWWDGSQFVRLQDDPFKDRVFVFFHIWREFEI